MKILVIREISPRDKQNCDMKCHYFAGDSYCRLFEKHLQSSGGLRFKRARECRQGERRANKTIGPEVEIIMPKESDAQPNTDGSVRGDEAAGGSAPG
jgi:hypothetical protein